MVRTALHINQAMMRYAQMKLHHDRPMLCNELLYMHCVCEHMQAAVPRMQIGKKNSWWLER